METYLFHLDKDIRVVRKLELSGVPRGEIQKYWLHLVTNGIGQPIHIPVLIARGKSDGPVLGITAAIHGNEINGLFVIQRMFRKLQVEQLSGIVIGIPVVNVPSFLRKQRRFPDGTDLNHIMPGKENGNVSEVYAYRFVQNVVKNIDFLIDLHTASFGRINSYYVRADMEDEQTAALAYLQNPDIIVHNPPSDGTLRGAADEMGIPAVTLEIGDPNRFQKDMVQSAYEGVQNAMVHLRMIDGEILEPNIPPVECSHSYWIYADTGGILSVHPELTDFVHEGDVIATIHNAFGDIVKRYKAPEEGVVIGKNVHPMCQTGGRILHLGVLG